MDAAIAFIHAIRGRFDVFEGYAIVHPQAEVSFHFKFEPDAGPYQRFIFLADGGARIGDNGPACVEESAENKIPIGAAVRLLRPELEGPSQQPPRLVFFRIPQVPRKMVAIFNGSGGRFQGG